MMIFGINSFSSCLPHRPLPLRFILRANSIEEAIDLTKYYLSHEEELRQIAANGWRRAIDDYNEVAVFKRLVDAIEELTTPHLKNKSRDAIILIRTRLLKNEFLMLRGYLNNKFQIYKSRITKKTWLVLKKIAGKFRRRK
jgi:hypothetical protein